MIDNLNVPPKFSGAAQLQLYTRYGDPEEAGFEEKWINHWVLGSAFPWFPAEHMLVHKHFRTALDAAFRDLEMLDLHTEIKSFDGAFRIRKVRGSSTVLSIHSWGFAIDLNAALNPLASDGTWTEAFLRVMNKHGIYCGQQWPGRKDPMHFALVNG